MVLWYSDTCTDNTGRLVLDTRTIDGRLDADPEVTGENGGVELYNERF